MRTDAPAAQGPEVSEDAPAGPPVERVRCLVVGAGVVGAAVTWQLALRGHEPLLVERALDVGEGASKANSGIVHTGFDARTGSLEADMLRRARPLWDDLVAELSLPFLRVGALMVGREPAELERLSSTIRPAASAMGVETEVLGRRELHEAAPWLDEGLLGALSIPGEAVVDPFWLTRAYVEAALAAGARVRLGTGVTSMDLGQSQVDVRLLDGGRIVADQVVNCAGLFADEVARLAGDDGFSITPRKGQFLVSEETFGVDRIVLPIPGPMGKGMLVTPIVFGGLLLGPTATDQEDKGDRSVDGAGREAIEQAVAPMVPALRDCRTVRHFCGLRTVSSTGDYILEPSRRGDRLFHAAGIRSTGVSTSPAVGMAVADAVERLRGWRHTRAPRAVAAAPREWSSTTSQELVCLCRSVGRPEVEAALGGPLPATTLDGLKRRCGVMFGDCQGNLCAAAAAGILAASLGVPVDQVTRTGRGSWLFRDGGEVRGGEVRGGEVRAEGVQVSVPSPEGLQDLVIVGAGLAGIGVALGAVTAGLRPVVVERRARAGGALATVVSSSALTDREREALAAFEMACGDGQVTFVPTATVVGLAEGPGGWEVLVQGADGTREVMARAAVLATGGYIEPREHLAVDGPRPAGVVTADLVEAALAAGLRPGDRAVVIGEGRLAAGVACRLEDAGCRVVGTSHRPPVEIAGTERLEAVRLGETWQAADTLVLVHRLLPQAFLLRGLGLVDARPGSAPPADDLGRVADGLWAAGTCVRPDHDHRASLEDGARVGGAAVAWLQVTPR